MEIHEFLDIYGEDLKNGIVKEECIGEIFDFLLEMAGSDLNAVKSQLVRIYSHLLKYQYQPFKQSRSWINTIRDASVQLSILLTNKSLMNKISIEIQNDMYKKGVREAVRQTHLSKYTFPDNITDQFKLDHLIDDDYIDAYLVRYACSDQAKKELGI